MSSNLTRICVQKVLNAHADYYVSIKDTDHLRAAFWTSKLWTPGITIKVGFLDEPLPNNGNHRTTEAEMKKVGRRIDPLQETLANANLKDAVKTILKERIQPLVNLNIEFINSVGSKKAHDADIRISFAKSDQSWSLVGTDSNHKEVKPGGNQKSQPSINLGWYDVGTYIHELFHAFGAVHEHQNPRGISIEWNVPKVEAWLYETQGWNTQQVKKNVLDKYNIKQINGSLFDPLSVMIYFFPSDITLNNKGSRQNFEMSGLDAKWLAKSYPHGAENPAIFYPKVYNQSLSNSIAQSASLRHQFDNVGNPSLSTHTGLYLGLGVISVLILIGLILIVRKLMRRR